MALAITILFGATDEVHQIYVPTREGHIADLIIDSFGGILGLSITNMVSTMGKKKSTQKNKDREKMPLWPVLLGVFVLLAGFAYALFYYNSYCHLF